MLAIRIKSEREKKRLSQFDLSKHIGVSQQTIASWEVGRTEPDVQSIIKLANFFNISTDYLLGQTENTADLQNFSNKDIFEEKLKNLPPDKRQAIEILMGIKQQTALSEKTS